MPSDFDDLIRQHGARIHRIARRYASGAAVDDMVQDILVRLWHSYPSFRAEAKIETWIYRVAFNAAMTHVKAAIGERQARATLVTHLQQSTAMPAGPDMGAVLESFLGMLNDIAA